MTALARWPSALYPSAMTKVACNQCGALILPRTAGETGGICMACKQGIRASMEASRAFYQKLKEYDPNRDLWKWLVGEAQADPNLGGFSPAQRQYFAVGLLEGDVYNGGFDQFFSNSSGAYYADAVAGLKALEAENALKILHDAAKLVFGSAPPPTNQQDRWNAMQGTVGSPGHRSEAREAASQLEALDRLFWEDPDELGERLAAFAQQSGILKPFEKQA